MFIGQKVYWAMAELCPADILSDAIAVNGDKLKVFSFTGVVVSFDDNMSVIAVPTFGNGFTSPLEFVARPNVTDNLITARQRAVDRYNKSLPSSSSSH